VDKRVLIEKTFGNAPFSQQGWLDALHVMAEATGSARGQLIFMGERHLKLNYVTNITDEYHTDFRAIEGHRPDVNWRVGASGAPFEVIYERHYDAFRAQHTDERYLEHVRRFDAEDGVQTVLFSGHSGTFGLAALNARSDGRTRAEDREIFAVAARHALAALRVQIALESQGADLVRGSLEALKVAAVLVDGHGRVCGITPSAEAVLSSGAFRVVQGRMMARTRKDDVALQARLSRGMNGGNPAGPDWWTRVSGRPCLVEVNRLPERDWTFGFQPHLIVTFRFPVPIGRDDAGRLGAALPLTHAEAEVLALLAAGAPRATIAAARGTSVETVSTQLRAIFAKCEVRREAELVALAVKLLAPR
jgi:DNA-binding CsgD family transcriptional regulator